MNKILLGCLALAGSIFTSCAGNKADSTTPDNQTRNSKVLVAFYSATGTTKKAAEEIATATGGKLYEIEPAHLYTAADLNWHDQDSRSSVEMKDMSIRPAIKNGSVNLDKVETVFIGYPIWWDQAPRVVNTFIDENNLAGKKIITFCTSGGSTINGSTTTLKETYPDLDIAQGICVNSSSTEDFNSWIESLNLKL